MNQIIQAVLGAFSNQSIEIKTARKLADLKKLDPVHLWAEKEDILIKTEYEKIPLRLYFPSKKPERFHHFCDLFYSWGRLVHRKRTDL